jgi:hypothetical protein
MRPPSTERDCERKLLWVAFQVSYIAPARSPASSGEPFGGWLDPEGAGWVLGDTSKPARSCERAEASQRHGHFALHGHRGLDTASAATRPTVRVGLGLKLASALDQCAGLPLG